MPEDSGGWVVADGGGLRWRTWSDGLPVWTADVTEATRYYRREDAEAVHREDEDAWLVVPYVVAAREAAANSST